VKPVISQKALGNALQCNHSYEEIVLLFVGHFFN